MPKISIIMGVYNGEKYLSRSIDSILNQTYRDFEFIICDDCSTDNTSSILSTYSIKDSRIILLKNAQNSGLSKSLNRCIKIAKGDYIARMDDDDISLNIRLETQIEFLEKNSHYSLVSSRRIFFDNDGDWGKDFSFGERTKTEVFKGHSFVHPSVFMKKDALNIVGGYNESDIALRTEDYDLWCKFYHNGFKGYVLPEYLIKYNESRLSYNKRLYKYRLNEFKLRLIWRKKFNLNFFYFIYVLKPLLVGLIPVSIMIKHKKRKYKND